MSAPVKFEISGSYYRWVKGLNDMDKIVAKEAVTGFKQAAETFYDRTQDVVHVDTGRLKASGSVSTEARGGEVESRLEYDTDYAIIEERRGGSHAYITRGWQATESLFEEALPETWAKVVSSWR